MSSILRIDQILDRLGTGPAKASEGLLLPNAAKPGSGTLDWYEEGVWTPTLTCDTPGTLALTYSNQWGIFTRVGRQVHLSFRIGLSTFTLGTATGATRIAGLPFTPLNTGGGTGYFGACMTNGIDVAAPSPGLWMDSSLSYIFLYGTVDNASWASTGINFWAAGDGIIGSITYNAG